MEDFNYQKTFELCKAYASLGERKQRIVEFMFERDIFKGNFSDLTRQLNYDVKKNASNIRKEVQTLERLGLICVYYNSEENDYKVEFTDDGERITKYVAPLGMFLVDGWMDNLIKHYKEEV